jgi:hypothetical protein
MAAAAAGGYTADGAATGRLKGRAELGADLPFQAAEDAHYIHVKALYSSETAAFQAGC